TEPSAGSVARVIVGFPLNVPHALYSASVTADSVGNPPKPTGVFPVLLYLNTGWLNAFKRSTRKLSRRLPSPPINGRLKVFWIEASKYCWMGARRLIVRGELPREPFTGRINAAGFTHGSQPPPIGQVRDQSGFFRATPGTISIRTERFTPPSRLVSVINGVNECLAWNWNKSDTDQPPT